MCGANQIKNGECISELNDSCTSVNDGHSKKPSTVLESLNDHMTGEKLSMQQRQTGRHPSV